MVSLHSRSFFGLFAAFFLPGAHFTQAAAPVLDDPVPAVGTAKVIPTIPVAKTLLLPITAYDDDGDPLTFTVTSSNPSIMVRVKTGNPLLKLSINHAAGADPVADPAYSGDLVFQLFRDWTPFTTGYIGGFAQAGVFNNVKLQRFADLNGASDLESLIYQGGATISTNFENEFKAPLIFSGRGQLAMANAGSNNFKGTNAGQIFITHGNFPVATSDLGGPRHLDFKHTVFGQLTHGWDLLEYFKATPKTAGDAPVVDVRITDAGLMSKYDDGIRVYTAAVLVLSATKPGVSTITVTVSDGQGAPVSKTFVATAQPDTHNSLPFLTPPERETGPKDKIFSVPLPRDIDLEFDYLTLASRLIDVPRKGQTGQQLDSILLLGDPGYEGPLTLGIGTTQFEMSHRGAIDGPAPGASDSLQLQVGVGDTLPKTEAVSITGAPGVGLSNVVVAKFADGDTRGGASAFTGRINWGDGTITLNGSVTPDPSSSAYAGAVVKGSHTYNMAGVYTVTVELIGNKGAMATVRSTAVITANPLVAIGKHVEFNGKTVSKRILATFTDSAALPGDTYSAVIDWGDGGGSPGIITALDGGVYAVSGVHKYADRETFSLRIQVHKTGTASATDAVAWSSIELSGFTAARHLPPFPISHLIGEISAIDDKPIRAITASGTSETATFTCQMVVVNSGNVTSKPGTLRFYLSLDKKRTKLDPANPLDIPLKIGTFPEFKIPALKPGAGIRYVCDKGGSADYRLKAPLGENGSGLNLIGVLTYSDPTGDHEPIDIAAVHGPFEGVRVSVGTLQTTEALGDGHTKAFSVTINRKPAAGKKYVIKVTSNNILEGTIESLTDKSPASLTDPDVLLEFTSINWKSAQEVVVTGVDDGLPDGLKTYKVVLSVDPSTDDPRFMEMDPDDVTVTNVDSSPKAIVTPVTLVTTEAAGPRHTGEFSVRFDQFPAVGQVIVVNVVVENVGGSATPLEGTTDVATLTFTEADATTLQKVTFTAADDSVPDGDRICKVKLTIDPVLTTDPRFLGLDPADVTVTNRDNEPKLVIAPLTLKTTEAAGAAPAKFSVKLDQLPTADVTMTVVSTDLTEGTVDKATLTFTATDATTTQFVTVTGVDDAAPDGPKTYNVRISTLTSTDPRFNGVAGANVSVTNLDDD